MSKNTRFTGLFLLTAIILMLAGNTFAGSANLIVNGNFEDPENPTKGWNLDWHHDDGIEPPNLPNVAILKKDGLKRNVLQVKQWKGEPKVLSPVAKFEFGKRYLIECDVRTDSKTTVRLYPAGLKWKPGIRPYDNPHIGDMRLIYKGTVVTVGTGWKRIKAIFPHHPYDKLSPLAKKHLRPVRFVGLYSVTIVGGAIYFDNCVIKETK